MAKYSIDVIKIILRESLDKTDNQITIVKFDNNHNGRCTLYSIRKGKGHNI